MCAARTVTTKALKIPRPPPRPVTDTNTSQPTPTSSPEQPSLPLPDLGSSGVFVLDTNALLDYPEVLTRPDSVLVPHKGVTEIDRVVIPLTCVRELDKLKSKPGKAGRNARRVVRILDGSEPGLSPKVVLQTYADETTETELEPPLEWDPGKFSADTEILAVTYRENKAESETSSPVTLVTNDGVLRVKARHMGLDAMRFNPPEDKSEEPYSGILEIPPPLFDFTTWFQEDKGSNKGQHTGTGSVMPQMVMSQEVINELSPNQFLIVKTGNGGADIVLRYLGPDRPLHKVPEWKLKRFEPRNLEQRLALDLLLDPEVVLVTLLGRAGGGKTLCALAAGLHMTTTKHAYQSMVITRPILPMGKDIGYLPGELEEKVAPWLEPIKDNLRHLLGANDPTNGGGPSKGPQSVDASVQNLYDKGTLEILAMPYIRGRSITKSWFLVDEAQGTTPHEIKTILTRVGDKTKVILTGDIDQIDRNDLDGVTNGLTKVVTRFRSSPLAGHVTLVKGERSALATLAAKIL